MTGFLRTEMRNGVAVLWIDVPDEKVNLLKPGFEDGLEGALGELVDVEGVVLASAKPGSFVAGADIRQLASESSADEARALSRRAQEAMSALSRHPAPSVAAIGGACLGGGLELALACDTRVAAKGEAELGALEVKLGLIPGAGGTQRLPRLIGLEPALDLILTGKKVSADEALGLGLVDEVVHPAILLDVALERARALARRSDGGGERFRQKVRDALSPHRIRSLVLEDNPAGRRVVLSQARKKTLAKTRGNYPAPLAAIDVVRAGLEHGIEEGFTEESKRFGELAVSPEARSLMALYFTRQELKKERGAEASPREIHKIAVVGAGLMGSGIASTMAENAEVRVRLKDVEQEAIRAGLRSIHEGLARKVKKGRLGENDMGRILSRIRPSIDYRGFEGVDLTIEAVPENLELKWKTLQETEEATPHGSIFASNTSSIPIGRIAEKSRRPETVVGMHYFSPVEKVPLLEVVRGEKTAPAVVATAVELGKRQGKTVIVVEDGAGFYTSRILGPYVNEAARLLSEGAAIEAVDEALEDQGFPVGPLRLLDEVGIDVAEEIAGVLEDAFGERMRPAPLLKAVIDDERYGKKNGRGFYRYKARDGGYARVDQEADETIYRLVKDRPAESPAKATMARRCLLAMVNEAARCLDEGIVRSARDGDAGAVFGLGFPPFLGGPFRYVDGRGARGVVDELQGFADRHGPRFEPAPLLMKLAESEEQFHPGAPSSVPPSASAPVEPAPKKGRPEGESGGEAVESSSFAKALFCGELAEERVFPYPSLDGEERSKVEALIDEGVRFLEEHHDPERADREGRLEDDLMRGLGERGLLGLYVPEAYSGQGLSQLGYCRVTEALSALDPTIGVVLGVHQSIGLKGIEMFGTEEQKERFLPDLATGRKLAGFALTEPNAGSDAYHLETRAVLEPDRGYRVNGEKRWIGNGSKDVLVTFARTEEGEHIALIVEKGMEGFEVGRSYETMGLRANDLRHLHFRDVKVPPENVLGAEGEGFKIAMEILNNGRMSLGAGVVGGAKTLLEKGIDHVRSREQFGRPLADFPLVEEKVAWIVTHLYAIESMTYMTAGLCDRGVPDYSVESAMVKLSSTEFVWYAANRIFQLAGGEAYMRGGPYERILRDLRVFPIFEGANDVLRLFIALSGLEALGAELEDLRHLDLKRPIASLGTLMDFAGDRIRREIRPPQLTRAHSDLANESHAISGQVDRLRDVSEKLLRRHGEDVEREQHQLKRLASAACDVYAQVSTISRLSRALDEGEDGALDDAREVGVTFCRRARDRFERTLDRVDANDDDRTHGIARSAYDRGRYGLDV